MAARPQMEPGSQTGATAKRDTDYWKALGLVRIPPLAGAHWRQAIWRSLGINERV